MQNNVGGLKRPKWDPRHFSYKKLFGATELPTQDFDVWTPLTTYSQGENQLCTDYAAIGAAEAQFKEILDVCFQRAAHNRITGTPGYMGAADPVDALKAVQKIGAISESESPYRMTTDPSVFADLSKYAPGIVLKAGTRKEMSFLKVNGGVDMFDSIRMAMFNSLNTGFPVPVIVGAEWRKSWLGAPQGRITTNDKNESFTDHAFVATGQRENGTLIRFHLSSGTEVGDGGFFTMPREIVNKFLFAFVFTNRAPDELKTELWNALQSLYDALFNMWKSLV